MPQLDFATYVPQLIWLVITFGLLYLLMSRVALPRIGTVIEERRDRIADDLDKAAELKRQTEETIEAYEEALAEARAKAHAIAQETRDKLTAETEEHRQKLEAELDKRLEEAESRITATKEAAMQNVRGISVDLAGAIVERLVGEGVDGSAAEAAVDKQLG